MIFKRRDVFSSIDSLNQRNSWPTRVATATYNNSKSRIYLRLCIHMSVIAVRMRRAEPCCKSPEDQQTGSGRS